MVLNMGGGFTTGSSTQEVQGRILELITKGGGAQKCGGGEGACHATDTSPPDHVQQPQTVRPDHPWHRRRSPWNHLWRRKLSGSHIHTRAKIATIRKRE